MYPHFGNKGGIVHTNVNKMQMIKTSWVGNDSVQTILLTHNNNLWKITL